MSENHQTSEPETEFQNYIPHSDSAEVPAQPVTVAGFKIDKGIPIPDFQSGRSIGSKFDPLFAGMVIGDSVAFLGDSAAREVSSLQRVAKKRGIRFATRKIVEDGVSGIRVWRRDGR